MLLSHVLESLSAGRGVAGAEGASLKCGLASAAKNPFAKKYSPVKELFIYEQLTIGAQTSRSVIFFFFWGGCVRGGVFLS